MMNRRPDLPTGDQAIEANRRLQKIVLRERTRCSWGNLLQALREEAEYWASISSDERLLARVSREKEQKMMSRIAPHRWSEEEEGDLEETDEDEPEEKKPRMETANEPELGASRAFRRPPPPAGSGSMPR